MRYVPCERESKPVGDAPACLNDPLRQPDAPGCLIVCDGARCQVYRHKQDDACWEP